MVTARQSSIVQRRLARRPGASDVMRLASDYQRQVQSLTSQFETEFDRYQEMVAQQMAPFEEAMQQYQDVEVPQFESALAQFQERYGQFQEQLKAIEADPVTERVERVRTGRTWYGRNRYSNVTFFDPKPIPTFTEQAPDRPETPMAPQISDFDSSGFDQRRGQLQEGFQREMGERRGARLQATRRTTRTLLSGVR